MFGVGYLAVLEGWHCQAEYEDEVSLETSWPWWESSSQMEPRGQYMGIDMPFTSDYYTFSDRAVVGYTRRARSPAKHRVAFGLLMMTRPASSCGASQT